MARPVLAPWGTPSQPGTPAGELGPAQQERVSQPCYPGAPGPGLTEENQEGAPAYAEATGLFTPLPSHHAYSNREVGIISTFQRRRLRLRRVYLLGFCQLRATDKPTPSGLNDKGIYPTNPPKVLDLANSNSVIQGPHGPPGQGSYPLRELLSWHLGATVSHRPQMAAKVSGTHNGGPEASSELSLPCDTL